MSDESINVLGLSSAAKGLEFHGSGTITLSDSKTGVVELTEEVAFQLELRPLGDGCTLTCWSPSFTKTKYGIRKAKFDGLSQRGIHITVAGITEGTRLDGINSRGVTYCDIHCDTATLQIEPYTEIPEYNHRAWSAPLVGVDFWGEGQITSEHKVANKGGEDEDELLLGWETLEWFSDFDWGEYKVRLSRQNEKQHQTINGIQIVGTVSIGAEHAITRDEAFEQFSILYDLLAPHSDVLWHPTLIYCSHPTALEWRHSKSKAVTTANGYYCQDEQHSPISLYAAAVTGFYDSLDTAEKKQALRELSKHISSAEFPITTGILSTCAGFEIMRSHFWKGETRYRFPKAAVTEFKRATKTLGLQLKNPEHGSEFEQERPALADQFLKRPLKYVVKDMVVEFMVAYQGWGVNEYALKETIQRRNVLVHDGLLKSGDDEFRAMKDSLDARKMLWHSFLGLIGMKRIVPER